MDYIAPKLTTLRNSGTVAWAEMGWLDFETPGPCVVMAQGKKENLVAVVLAKVGDGKISSLGMCGVPSPHSARRSGEYPGR